jgi:hypothetical protein
MAKSSSELSRSLRGRGIRRKVADEIARAVDGKGKPRAARRALSDLTAAVMETNDELRRGPEKRSAAAKKAARWRKPRAEQRSKAARRGARKRAGTT